MTNQQANPASPIYLVTCPPWCNQKHPILISADQDPLADQLGASELIDHATELVADSHGLAVELVQTQKLQGDQLKDHPAALNVYIDGNTAATGLSPNDLKAWSTALQLAADLANQVTKWH